MICCSPCHSLLLCQNGLVSLQLLLMLLPLHLAPKLCRFLCRCPLSQIRCLLSQESRGLPGMALHEMRKCLLVQRGLQDTKVAL